MLLRQFWVFFILFIIMLDLAAMSPSDKKISIELAQRAEEKLISIPSSQHKVNTEIEQLLAQALTLNPQKAKPSCILMCKQIQQN